MDEHKKAETVFANFVICVVLALMLATSAYVEYRVSVPNAVPISTIGLASLPMFGLLNVARHIMQTKDPDNVVAGWLNIILSVVFIGYFACPLVTVAIWVLSK